MHRALSIGLILIGVTGPSVLSAQGRPDPLSTDTVLPKAWSLLTSTLRSRDLQEQLSAVSALSIAETPCALETVTLLARTGSGPVRSTALWFLPTHSGEDFIPLLTDAVKDSDASVRSYAIRQLGFVRDDRALALLEEVIVHSEDVDDEIEAAVSSARILGAAGIRPLLAGVKRPDDKVTLPSLRTIETLVNPEFSENVSANLAALRSQRAVPLLVDALRRDSEKVRRFAALILARLGNDAGVPELLRAVESSDYGARAALLLLGRGEYLASLNAALQGADAPASAGAIWAMHSFRHPSFTPLLTEVWNGTSDLRYVAFKALTNSDAEPDLKLLRQGLSDSDPFTRLRAAQISLTRVGPDDSVLDVVEQLAFVRETRLEALRLLTEKGDPNRTARVARLLLPISIEEDAQVRGVSISYTMAVVSTIGAVKDSQSVASLAALFGPDRNVNYAVVRALVAIGDDASRQALVRAMDSEHASARIVAAGGVINLYSH
jgi:HEAT repeat protein